MNLIHTFESVNTKSMYRTDLEEFIKESRLEDFYDDNTETITVSTIHKAKGREFDTVILMLKNYDATTDDKIRCLYVGMTRAKKQLLIHCNSFIFNNLQTDSIEREFDNVQYTEPNKVTYNLTHHDVYLDFFKERKNQILKLKSGDELYPNGEFLFAEINGSKIPILKYSKAFSEALQSRINQGFSVVAAEVRFVVAWKGKEDDSETAVILPSVTLEKK